MTYIRHRLMFAQAANYPGNVYFLTRFHTDCSARTDLLLCRRHRTSITANQLWYRKLRPWLDGRPLAGLRRRCYYHRELIANNAG